MKVLEFLGLNHQQWRLKKNIPYQKKISTKITIKDTLQK
jgi:hypothetical protein